jgi:peptide/nickel transport system permease protein
MTAIVTGAAPTPQQVVAHRGARTSLLRAALRARRTQVGLVLAGIVVLVALVGPYVVPFSPTDFVGIPFNPPGDGASFGTDNIGRDVLSRFLAGGRSLLALSVVATVLGVGLGAVIGIVAGYLGGWRDEAIMRTVDVVLAFPQVVLSLLFLSIIGPKLWLIVAVTALGHAPRTARVMRDAALGVVERDFIKAAEATGVRRTRIMATEIAPNVTGPLMVELGLRLTFSIGLIAALSFLGLGLQPPTPDWGLMINENRIALTVQPWAVILPVAAIAILTIGTNLVTDGLARASAGIDRAVSG